MNQICCLNPDCHNPPVPDKTKFCPHCGIPLVILKNRYRPVKPLGGGGFGKTYLAKDIDKLNEKCVIKQFAPQNKNTYALNKAKELFTEEAIRLQQLKHPQIPQLQAYFDENNCLYLIQDFIDGDNLLVELANGETFENKKIRQLLLDILPVLKKVHDRGIIHRDIKPENIMRHHGDGKLFLIDFGASKQLQGTMRPGTVIGSFGYASLEQMEDRQVYPASDLFSLGASCFHLMTRVHPWNLWKTQGYSWVNDWRKHLQQSVSLELGQILDKLLRLEYQDRYQSAEEVLKILQTPPKPPTPRRPTPQPPKPQSVQPQPVQTNSSRRGFLQTTGLFIGGVTVAVVGQKLLSNKDKNQTSKNTTSSNTPTPQNTPTSEISTSPNNLQTFNFEVVTTDSTGNITNRRNNSAKYFEEDLGNDVKLEMVEIPGGTFYMGSPENEKNRDSDESPQHQVTVPGFFMAKYQLTQAQYQAIIGTNPANFKGDNRPVERVSWDDAVIFCQRLSQKTGKSYRLPSESEWEYACRAGTTTPFYFGESITPDLVNYDGNNPYASAPKGQYRQQTTDVGTFPPNAFGLYDMHGNVYEWCLDDYQDNYNNAPVNGTALTSLSGSFKLLRGGSWLNDARNCRSANRNSNSRDYRNDNVGFRVVVVART